MIDLVCAWCDVYARVPCETRDDQGHVVQSWTKCAYCGRTASLRKARPANPDPAGVGLNAHAPYKIGLTATILPHLKRNRIK